MEGKGREALQKHSWIKKSQESQSFAGFKTGKQAKAKKNVDPLLKEVWDLVTTALLTSAFSVCLGFSC